MIMKDKDRITIGILAHVDAGKTTLSEAILYKCGAIRKAGRVDHRNAFMDTDEQEKERGITIFSGQAQLLLPLEGGGQAHITLLDTPGHVDFISEMERTLGVLDYAILVISGKDGIRGHTVTLWNLLERYRVPVFFFVNKMDMEGSDRQRLLEEIRTAFGTECLDFSNETVKDSRWAEEAAMCSEELMEEYLDTGSLSQNSLAKAIKGRDIFPCYFGSALKQEGVDELLGGLSGFAEGFSQDYIREYEKAKTLLRVFRITRDEQGERLTHVKVLRGTLKVRDTVNGEKVNQIRMYSGKRYHPEEQAGPGTVCCLTGPVETKIGQITGDTVLDMRGCHEEAVISYSMILPEGTNVHDTYIKLKQLEEEDPQLHIMWNEQLQEIQARLMGRVQLEVLEELISRRFGIEIRFGEGKIAYRETIRKAVMGAGHYEPLKHYSEVHLLLEPLPRGGGMQFASAVSGDVLDTNRQRLIMQHLMEKEHAGTLTGSPITDIKITIVGGRAHEKHTEGGDFRQAAYRAVRQALRKSLDNGDMILLEPRYKFEMRLPPEMVGRAMSDVHRMGGSCELCEEPVSGGSMSEARANGETALLIGKAPVSGMKDYGAELASYTRGYGCLTLQMDGYEICHDQEEIVSEIAYEADRDVNNPADSIFCSHGAGCSVPWNEADEMMHVSLRASDICGSGEAAHVRGIGETADHKAAGGGDGRAAGGAHGFTSEDEEDLERIFERTYRRSEKKNPGIEARELGGSSENRKRKESVNLPEYLLVDGYNIIFAWDELKELAKVNIDAARESLIEILGNYIGFRKCEVIVVFDAYRVRGGQRHTDNRWGIRVVFTAEAETADTYIERATYELSGKTGAAGKAGGAANTEPYAAAKKADGIAGKTGVVTAKKATATAAGKTGAAGKFRVRVATSDRLEQMIVTGNNARKISADDFRREIEQVNEEISEYIRRMARKNKIENPNKLEIPQNEHKGVIE